jgi:hypothetical protein
MGKYIMVVGVVGVEMVAMIEICDASIFDTYVPR